MRVWILLAIGAWAAAAQDQSKSIQPLEIGRRVALLIGNGRYQHQPAISTASADVDDMAAVLRTLGFQQDNIIVRKDLDMNGMTSALSAFRSRIRSGDLAVFYYSGHGGQASEQNFLLPVEFQAVDEEAILPRVAYPMSEIRDLVERAGARVRLLVFDACRTASLVNGKDIGTGLKEISGQPEGTLIAYASAHNQIARFSPGARNSFYTAELLAELRQPSGSLKEKLEAAQSRVFRATGGRQTPYLYGFLSGPVYLGARAALLGHACADGWAMVKDTSDENLLRNFARDFAECGAEVRLARLRLSVPEPRVDPRVAEVPKSPRTNPKDGQRYLWIPPGSFQMGCSPNDEECFDREKPAKQVALTKGFWLGETEVTQSAYQKVTGKNPSNFKGADLPVETVNWYDAQGYCKQAGGRLPTDAEWEHAARGGGNSSARYGDVDRIGWYDKNSGNKTHPVKGKAPNDYGLYDMLGNVWEWTADWFAAALPGGTDPSGPSSGEARVLRGGSWFGISRNVRASVRSIGDPTFRDFIYGFRCASE